MVTRDQASQLCDVLVDCQHCRVHGIYHRALSSGIRYMSGDVFDI